MKSIRAWLGIENAEKQELAPLRETLEALDHLLVGGDDSGIGGGAHPPEPPPRSSPGSVWRRGSRAVSISASVNDVISRASSRTGRRVWNERFAISAALS